MPPFFLLGVLSALQVEQPNPFIISVTWIAEQIGLIFNIHDHRKISDQKLKQSKPRYRQELIKQINNYQEILLFFESLHRYVEFKKNKSNGTKYSRVDK